MLETTTEQIVNKKAEERIGRTVDVIASAKYLRFTGFQKPLNEDGPIGLDAAAIFVDNDKPKGKQEVRVPMEQLAEVYYRITSGTYDPENLVYSFQVGGQQRTMAEERISELTYYVFEWDLRSLTQGRTILYDMKQQGK